MKKLIMFLFGIEDLHYPMMKWYWAYRNCNNELEATRRSSLDKLFKIKEEINKKYGPEEANRICGY